MARELHLPALRSLMGEWVYYVTSMRLKEVADRVVYAENLSTSKALRDLLQRKLKGSRTKQIADYLAYEPQHFLGALIVSVHDGQPKWLELAVRPTEHFDMEDMDPDARERLEETVGFLRLEGDEKLWALDGQHRLSGIKEVIGRNPEMGSDEVTVIFVGHEETESGKQRTRRLFTTLNRNAKAITIGERIALDEDDACAIITRRLLRTIHCSRTTGSLRPPSVSSIRTTRTRSP